MVIHGILVHIGVLKDAQLELGIQNPAAGIGEPLLVHLVHQLCAGANAHAAQNVGTCVGCTHKVQTPIGLNDAGVAQLPPQQVGHDHGGLVGRIIHGIAAQHGNGGIAIGHHGGSTRCNAGLEARQMQLQGILLNGQGRSVHAAGLCACAGKMLDGGNHGITGQLCTALECLDSSRNQALHHLGVLAVAFLVASPAGVGDQVGIRRQRHADAHRLQLLLQHRVQLRHQRRIIGSTLVHLVRQEGSIADEGSARLGVHGEHHRDAQLAGLAQLLNFIGALGGIGCGVKGILINQGEAHIAVGEPAVFLANQGQVYHLGGLLLRGHLTEQVFGALLGGEPPVFIGVQHAVVIEVFEGIAVHFDDVFHPCHQFRLLEGVLRMSRQGGKAQDCRHRQGGQLFQSCIHKSVSPFFV